jgi:hypothetical protein
MASTEIDQLLERVEHRAGDWSNPRTSLTYLQGIFQMLGIIARSLDQLHGDMLTRDDIETAVYRGTKHI